jgi:hypothetical protein
MSSLADAAGSARRALAGVCDLERALARLAASAGGEGGGVVGPRGVRFGGKAGDRHPIFGFSSSLFTPPLALGCFSR